MSSRSSGVYTNDALARTQGFARTTIEVPSGEQRARDGRTQGMADRQLRNGRSTQQRLGEAYPTSQVLDTHSGFCTSPAAL
jgi:hypothetical protein